MQAGGKRLPACMRISSLQISVVKGRLRSNFVFQLLLVFYLVMLPAPRLWGQTAAPAGLTIHGVVKSGNMPIPGAGVSAAKASPTEAANASTTQQVSTSTDVDGSYLLRIPMDGHYIVRVQMAAFAASTQEVVLDAEHQDMPANFELVLLSRAREAHPEPRQANAGGRGFQSLSVFQSATGQDASNASMSDVSPSGMPVPGIAPDSATESVAVSGNTSNSFNAMSADEMQQRFNDARQQGGGFGGGAGFGGVGGGAGGGGFGGGGFGRRGFDINRPHGSLYYGVGDSALNASPFSLTGQPTGKPPYLQNSFGGSVGGPLNIPHVYHGGTKTFYFINYNGKRAENPFDQFSTVPKALERSGCFAQTQAICSSGAIGGQAIEIFNPATNPPYPGDQIPQINAAALGLLNYI